MIRPSGNPAHDIFQGELQSPKTDSLRVSGLIDPSVCNDVRYSELATEMLSEPVVRKKLWQSMSSQMEVLATTLKIPSTQSALQRPLLGV